MSPGQLDRLQIFQRAIDRRMTQLAAQATMASIRRRKSSGYVVLVAVDPFNPRSLPVAGTAGRLIGP
jgi:hypothetical protein